MLHVNSTRYGGAGQDPDVHFLLLPPTANLEINALQRAATIILQKSVREGFGLTVTEAMWKGKPVIGGYTVNSAAGAAFYIKRLLNEPERINAIGRQAKEFVRNRFLVTRHVQDYFGIMIHLARGTA